MKLKTKLLFDTHAFLAFFNREEGSEIIRNHMDAIQNGDAQGFVATITLTELAYIYSRKMDEASGTLRVMQILHSKLNVIPLNAEIAIRAGTLKRPGISVADAIIAASALSVEASVVTNDIHFSEMGIDVVGYH
ncbi:MAG: PIN domain-containing protein [Methanoregula sp.]|nr:PIN domain-containing protein [Methanoregula sp.]